MNNAGRSKFGFVNGKKRATFHCFSPFRCRGKTTLCKAVLDHFPDMKYSVSTTTRKPRPGEIRGEDYFFISKEEFSDRIEQDQWAEWALVHENYYGTSARYINDQLSAGENVLLDIDVQGAKQILKRYPESVTIFIMPPAFEVLRERMMSRGSDSMAVIEKRLLNARQEMDQKDLYQHIIINDRLEEAKARLIALISSYHGY